MADARESLILAGHVSVGAWEQPCQEALVRFTIPAPSLQVLEIGYGLGMASNAIQSDRRPSIHVVIERDPTVAARALVTTAIQSVRFYVTDWINGCSCLADEFFDGILFDPDPEVPADISWSVKDVIAWVSPAILTLGRLLKNNGRLGFLDFTNEVKDDFDFVALIDSAGMQLEIIEFPISPPEDCKYARHAKVSLVVARKLG